MGSLRNAVPWWLRVGAKIALSRLPIPYGFWKRLGVFEHGEMNQPQRALQIFVECAGMAGLLDAESPLPRLDVGGQDFSVLEIGPGDSLFTAAIASCLGAARTWLIDVGTYATTDITAYTQLFKLLRDRGYELPVKGDPPELAEVLRACNGEYLTKGVESMGRLPPASVDYCFSNAVLEHISKADFGRLAAEMLRVLKPEGVCMHRVDLKDHLGGGLNNLRFSEKTWEGSLFRKSGFYTNRIRFAEMVRLFEETGFECHLPRIARWERLPTPRSCLSKPFQTLTDEELLVSGFDVVLRHQR